MDNKLIPLTITALSLTSCVMWVDEWAGEVRMASFQKSEPVQAEQVIEADLELHAGTMQIEAGSEASAYEMDLEYNEAVFEPQVDYQREGEVGRLHFKLGTRGESVRRVGNTQLNLRLSPLLPLRLAAVAGVGEAQIDLTGMNVDSVRLENGVGEAEISMLDANRGSCRSLVVRSGVGSLKMTGLGNFSFREFDFEGGVGHSTLDFSGDWKQIGEVEINVGVGGVEILLPRDIGAEIRVSRSFLSGFSISGFDQKSSDTYVSENLDRVSKVVRFRIKQGIGSVDVRWL